MKEATIKKKRYQDRFEGFGLGLKIIKKLLEKRTQENSWKNEFLNLRIDDGHLQNDGTFLILPTQKLPEVDEGDYNPFPEGCEISVKALREILGFFDKDDTIQILTPKILKPLILKNDEIMISLAPREVVKDDEDELQAQLELPFCPECGVNDDVIWTNGPWYKCLECNHEFQKEDN